MKLQQLRYFSEIVDRGLNVSEAALAIHTSQPGVSKQVRLLEEELGLSLFERSGKRLVALTEPGRAVLEMARRMLRDAENIRRLSTDMTVEDGAELTIATTHTQARYALPSVLRRFIDRHPGVRLNLRQGNPQQVAQFVLDGEADVAIATEALDHYEELVTLPCYQWNHCVVAPHGHPLFGEPMLSIHTLASHPLVTYDFSFAGRSHINQAFERHDLKPNIVLSALDADVIKTYVRLGLGVGIIAAMAWEAGRDDDLAVADCGHLFESNTTRLALRRGLYLRAFEYDFIELLASHLRREIVDAAMHGEADAYQL